MCCDAVYWFCGCSFFCLTGCFSMIVWTPAVFGCLICMFFYFCICTCSAQLSMFHMEKRSKNTLIIIISSIYLSISPSVCLSVYLSVYLLIDRLIHLSVCLSISFHLLAIHPCILTYIRTHIDTLYIHRYT